MISARTRKYSSCLAWLTSDKSPRRVRDSTFSSVHLHLRYIVQCDVLIDFEVSLETLNDRARSAFYGPI